MKIGLKLDGIALNFLKQALLHCPNPQIHIIDPIAFSEFYVAWDGEKVGELAEGKKVSLHNKVEKLGKFAKLKKAFLENKVSKRIILVVKDTDHKEKLIVDGIHRSVAFYQAYLENKNITKKTPLQMLFFESNTIKQMIDYDKLLKLIK
jgi:hypothetical protein